MDGASTRAAPAAEAPAEQPRLTYQPALDGWRGLGVLAILCYHAELTWARGTFLSLSGFFALSGYLITALLLAEHERHGRIDLRRFWSRRLRRLMPAAVVTLAAIVATTAAWGDASQLRNLRGDVLAALGYVANWRFVASGQSYADLFDSPSPVQHYWSLAVEEQFYVFLPLLAIGVLWWWRGSRRALALTIGGLLTASAVLMWVLHVGDLDRAYYGTDTRAAEFLTGALLAVLLWRRPPLSSPVLRGGVRVAGVTALVATVVLWVSIDLDGANTYPWAFLAAAGLTAIVILAGSQGGLAEQLLSWRPLRALGMISYGVYLIHWPVFLWLSPERTGLADAPLFALRLFVTVALATASYLLIEQPIRYGRRVTGWQPYAVAPAALAVVVVGVLAVTIDPGPRPLELASTEAAARPEAPPAVAEPEPGSDEPGVAVRVLVVGDSVSYNLADGMATGPAEAADLVLWNRAVPGCTLGRGGLKRVAYGEGETGEVCDRWADRWVEDLAAFEPEVVMLSASPWDATDRLVPGLGDRWRSFGDPDYERWFEAEVEDATRLLTSTGATLVWLTHPHIARDPRLPENDPARMDRMNEILHEVAARHDSVVVLDLATWLTTEGGGIDNPDVRHDGIHYTEPGARLVGEWLARELAGVAAR